MKYYFAPMEGITGYIFRNAHHACFSGVERYYTPFLAPGSGKGFSARELRDILPENNRGTPVTPQVLTCRGEDFIKASKTLAGYGYGEVNLNLGCPSGTVTAKGKGAGFLADPERLDRFLDCVFSELSASCPGLRISIKTRIGYVSEEEFPALLEIFNRYPVSGLIVHPRVREDYYKGKPRMEAFRLAAGESRIPLCYNGDIRSVSDAENVETEFPGLSAIMIGRGAVACPWLMEQLKDGRWKRKADEEADEETNEELRRRFVKFHDMLLCGYQEVMPGDRNVLFKMKELWDHFGSHFPEAAKELKRIRKAQRIAEYQEAARSVLQSGTALYQ